MGPFINLTTGRCNWLSQGGDTCVLATVAIHGVFGLLLGGVRGVLSYPGGFRGDPWGYAKFLSYPGGAPWGVFGVC